MSVARNTYSAPRDEYLRRVSTAVAKARSFDASQREVIAFVLRGYRGLSLPGPDDQRLAAILGAIWTDADDQREEQS